MLLLFFDIAVAVVAVVDVVAVAAVIVVDIALR